MNRLLHSYSFCSIVLIVVQFDISLFYVELILCNLLIAIDMSDLIRCYCLVNLHMDKLYVHVL